MYKYIKAQAFFSLSYLTFLRPLCQVNKYYNKARRIFKANLLKNVRLLNTIGFQFNCVPKKEKENERKEGEQK